MSQGHVESLQAKDLITAVSTMETAAVPTARFLINEKGSILLSREAPEGIRGAFIGLSGYRPTNNKDGGVIYYEKEVYAKGLLIAHALYARAISTGLLTRGWEHSGRLLKMAANILVNTYQVGGVAQQVSERILDLTPERELWVITNHLEWSLTAGQNDYDRLCARLAVVNYVLRHNSYSMVCLADSDGFNQLIDEILSS